MGLYDMLTMMSNFLAELNKRGDREAYLELNKIYTRLCRPMMHIGGDVPAACRQCSARLLEFKNKHGYTEMNVLVNALARFAEKA